MATILAEDVVVDLDESLRRNYLMFSVSYDDDDDEHNLLKRLKQELSKSGPKLLFRDSSRFINIYSIYL